MSREAAALSLLIATLVEKTRASAATEHVGHSNRLVRQRASVLAAIGAARGGQAVLRDLLGQADAPLQLAIAHYCKLNRLWPQDTESVLARLALRSDKIGRAARTSLNTARRTATRRAAPSPPHPLAYDPLPIGCPKTASEQIVYTEMPGRAAAIATLLRPALRLWPRAMPPDPRASRLGGMPAVPKNFAWPFANEEPLLFLAQINCAELCAQDRDDLEPDAGRKPVSTFPHPALGKSFGLPGKGLLAFFGDHDDVNGHGRAGGGAVFYFPIVDELRLASPPLEDFEPLIACGIGFYESYELPHPSSQAIERLGFFEEERSAYDDLRREISALGVQPDRSLPNEIKRFTAEGEGISKLFGWPDLIRHELDASIERRGRKAQALLLQLGPYHDGSEWQLWGPGGLVYVTLAARDLTARRFDRAELEMQYAPE